MLKPRIVIATGKQKEHGGHSSAIATAKYHRGKPTIYVYKPKSFTRPVYEHELAHLKDGSDHLNKSASTIDNYKDEIRAERASQMAMKRGRTLRDDNLFGMFERLYDESRRTIPKFTRVIKNHKDFIRYGEKTGLFKKIGFTEEEMHRLPIIEKIKDRTFKKKYLVTLHLKSGKRQVIDKSEIESTSKRNALEIAEDGVSALDTIWEVTDAKVDMRK
jgi:hypothetical protein